MTGSVRFVKCALHHIFHNERCVCGVDFRFTVLDFWCLVNGSVCFVFNLNKTGAGTHFTIILQCGITSAHIVNCNTISESA